MILNLPKKHLFAFSAVTAAALVVLGLFLLRPPAAEPQTEAPLEPQSVPSGTGITLKEELQMLPLEPPQVTAQSDASGVLVQWLGNGEYNIRYEIYRQNSNTVHAEDWRIVGAVESRGDNRGRYEWTDTATQPGAMYTYGVNAVNFYGAKSGIAQSMSILIDHR